MQSIPKHTSLRMNRSRSRARSGFTLMEVLLVITIISIVMVLASASFRDIGARPAKAMELTSGMAAIARDRAIATGSPRRVFVCLDPAAGDRYLRCVGVLADADGNPTTVGWKFFNNLEVFPPGTIFWPEFSTPLVPENTMKLDLKSLNGVQDGNTGLTCIFLEFDALGLPARSGHQWVFTKAVMDNAGGAPVIPKPMDRDGFIVRQTGALAYFRSPEQISRP